MRTSTPALILLILLLSGADRLSAQSQERPPAQPPVKPPVQPLPEQRPPSMEDTSHRGRFEPYLALTSAFDSNIEHDRLDTDSLGGVFGVGFVFRNDPADPTFEIGGEVAGHRWTNTSRWDRFSQKVTAFYEHDLPGRWSFDTAGEVSLKGSSEDREISDQYLVLPRVAFRLGSQNRVRLYVGLRARRYDEDSGRNAFNRYIGVEFTERAQPNRRWELDLRYEVNETESPRQHYNRWTMGLSYSLPVRHDRIDAEVRYRTHYYPFRLVEVDDVDVNRRDHRWIPKVTWTHPLSAGLGLRASYAFETRTSNDLDREFDAHLCSLAVVRRW